MVVFSFAGATVNNGAGLDGALAEADDDPVARHACPASMRTIREARPRRI